ncbi:glycosyltransferase family A protein [Lacticaseibacillus jixiensis]|uniref:glycosyltransferase family A protein n=1 Tax=Lacticaseibacillus jixiensis TaxID=3231926 RepID=UPI0036F224B6
MSKTLSLIIAMQSATVQDLAVPLSSINNQLGVDFRQVEVLLIDNGRYQLEDLEPLRVFDRLKFRYIKPAKIWSWQTAFEQGLMLATGQYVAFLGPNMQFNSVDVLQQLFAAVKAHPEAQLISGLLLNETMQPDRKFTYEVTATTHLLRGRFIARTVMLQNQIHFEDFGAYTELFVGQLIDAVAKQPQQLGAAMSVQFLGRTVPDAVLAPQPEHLQLDWVRMMTRYLVLLQKIAPDQYVKTLAKTIVRFYSQAGGDAAMTAQMAELTAQNAQQWPQVLAYIDELEAADSSPAAPWHAEAGRFAAYMQRVTPRVAAKP